MAAALQPRAKGWTALSPPIGAGDASVISRWRIVMGQQFDTRAGRLAAALDEFIHSSPDVEAAAVVSFDGLPMASALPDELEEDRVGAMSAALLSLGEQAALGLGRGHLNQVFVEGEHGFVFLMSARDQAVLAAVARRTAKIGFMLFEMRRAADRIGHALEPAEAPEAAFDRHQAQMAPPSVSDRAEIDDAIESSAADGSAEPTADNRPLDLVRDQPVDGETSTG